MPGCAVANVWLIAKSESRDVDASQGIGGICDATAQQLCPDTGGGEEEKPKAGEDQQLLR